MVLLNESASSQVGLSLASLFLAILPVTPKPVAELVDTHEPTISCAG